MLEKTHNSWLCYLLKNRSIIWHQIRVVMSLSSKVKVKLSYQFQRLKRHTDFFKECETVKDAANDFVLIKTWQNIWGYSSPSTIPAYYNMKMKLRNATVKPQRLIREIEIYQNNHDMKKISSLILNGLVLFSQRTNNILPYYIPLKA